MSMNNSENNNSNNLEDSIQTFDMYTIELNSDSNTEANANGLNEPPFKRYKNSHPLWKYFSQSENKKSITCSLCNTEYGHRTGI
ncbi:8412_t:CDS:1, partial [Cetraspora pellucida]